MEMRKCPFCAEEIQDEAIKCRYCGSSLGKQLVKKIGVSGYTQPKLLPRDFLLADEEIYLETRPYFWSKYLFVILVFIIITCFLPPLFIVILIVFLLFILQWRKTIYAITNKRVIKLKGLILKNYIQCPLDKVQNVEMKIFGQAVIFDTAGTPYKEIVWAWLKNPKEVYKKVNLVLHN